MDTFRPAYCFPERVLEGEDDTMHGYFGLFRPDIDCSSRIASGASSGSPTQLDDVPSAPLPGAPTSVSFSSSDCSEVVSCASGILTDGQHFRFPGGFIVAAPADVWVAPSGDICLFFGHYYNKKSSCSAAEAFALLAAAQGFENALSACNGDFAVAYLNAETGIFSLARDRLGVKPLFLASLADGGIAFASRPSLLFPLVGRDENRSYIARFLTCHYRYIDAIPEETPYARIQQLPAATLLETGGREVALKRWWRVPDLPDLDGSEAELAEIYRNLLLDAVRLRLEAADRPVFTLSGGMDSSSVLSCAVHISGERQIAYSTVYDDKTYDESDDIRTILDRTVSSWNPVAIGDPPVFPLIRRMLDASDIPVATATWLSHFLLCQRVSADGHRTILGGLGGDELNAGEYEHFFYYFADLRHQGREDLLDREIFHWRAHHDHPIYRKNKEVVEQFFRRCIDFSRPGHLCPEPARISMYRPALDPAFADLSAFEPPLEHPFSSWLKNRTWQDLIRETLPCCLRAEGDNCRAFGLDHMDPFLDYRLVEFAFRVPGYFKVRNGVTKILLRRAMEGIVPDETRHRIKKTGWNAPAHRWFSGANLDALRRFLHSEKGTIEGMVQPREVLSLLDRHEEALSRANTENHMMFLWQFANVLTFKVPKCADYL